MTSSEGKGEEKLDENLSEKIRAVLADPAALSAIASVASSLSGGSAQANVPSEQQSAQVSAPTETPSVPAVSIPKRDPRIDLLCAIKPLVNDEKRNRLDSLVQIATVASLLGTLGKKGGNGYV